MKIKANVGDTVYWLSPHSGEEHTYNYRGTDGVNAILYNEKSGMQISVPENEITTTPKQGRSDENDNLQK